MRDTRRTRAVQVEAPPKSYTQVKAEWEARIAAWGRRSIPPVEHMPTRIAFIWSERTAHRDPDGIASGGRKLLLDGLVRAGVLPGDGHAEICGFEDYFDIHSGNAEGVTVFFPSSADRRTAFFPHRLPDLNELLALRESSARRAARKVRR